MIPCECCGVAMLDPATFVSCDARMSSPPHVCLRWLTVISDQHGCQPTFPGLALDHETAWRLDQLGLDPSEGAGP